MSWEVAFTSLRANPARCCDQALEPTRGCATEITRVWRPCRSAYAEAGAPLKLSSLCFLVDQLMWMPEIAREITSRWISEVPSKIV